MEREVKMDLIQRMLGIRHKIKVHESMKPPETHEDLALMMQTKWELEDELAAIEELLAGARRDNITAKRKDIEKTLKNGGVISKKKNYRK